MNVTAVDKSLSVLLAGLAADDPPDLPVGDVELDSRRVRTGTLFLACRGRRSHGLAHVGQALARGAAAVAYEPAPGVAAPEVAVPVVAVPELARHAGEVAARCYDYPSRRLTCIGVTGTDGKTSTAHILTQALDQLGRPCLYSGTLGYGRLNALTASAATTPDAVELQRRLCQALEAGVRACAMEVSSHALDQGRVAGVEFDCAVLTNVGRDHLDYHGTVEAYAAVKRGLFELAPKAVLNLDDAFGPVWAAELDDGHATFGYRFGDEVSSARCTLRGRQLSLHPTGLGFETVSWRGETARVDSGLLGRFNAYNLLAAMTTLVAEGSAPEQAAAALSGVRTVPGRAEAFRVAGKPLVVVDYAHTPQALEQVLRALRPHTRGRLICVFGCGGGRDAGKRPLMGGVAARLADALIVTDDNPREEAPQAIVKDILSGLPDTGGPPVQVVHQRERAIQTAVAGASVDDVVLIAGKGHEDYQIYAEQRRDFSDRRFVAEVLGAPEERP